MVGPGRFELPASSLSGMRSDQLSYEPCFMMRSISQGFLRVHPPKKNQSVRDTPITKAYMLPHMPEYFLRKEVIQPLVLQRLPCYDLVHLIRITFGRSLLRAGWVSDFECAQLGWLDGRCVQGPGTYSPPYS